MSDSNVLVNNAGAYIGGRTLTEEGLEATFALNHLGYFLLTNLLLDLLKSSAPARIVNVASSAHQRSRIEFDDLMGERSYAAFRAYGQSKLANIMFTYELARRLDGTNVTVNCLHPGVVATNFAQRDGGMVGFLVKTFSFLLRRPAKGAETAVYLASSAMSMVYPDGTLSTRRKSDHPPCRTTNRRLAACGRSAKSLLAFSKRITPERAGCAHLKGK